MKQPNSTKTFRKTSAECTATTITRSAISLIEVFFKRSDSILLSTLTLEVTSLSDESYSPKPDADALEQALPGVIGKLKSLHSSLNADEKIILQEILASAADQTELLMAHEEGPPGMAFSKSMSVHSSGAMKAEYIKLAKELGD